MRRYVLLVLGLAGLGLLVFMTAQGDEEGSGLHGTFVLDLTQEQIQEMARLAVLKSKRAEIEALESASSVEREAQIAKWQEATATLLGHVDVRLELRKDGTYSVLTKFAHAKNEITGRWKLAQANLTLTPDPNQGDHPNATQVRETLVEGDTIRWSLPGGDVVLRRP